MNRLTNIAAFLLLLAMFAAFFFLMARGLDKSHDNYCSLYTTAKYCTY